MMVEDFRRDDFEVEAWLSDAYHEPTFHLAQPNTTGTVPRVHDAIHFDGSTQGEGRYPHPSVERAGIAAGARIASLVIPLAWPVAANPG